MKIALAKCKYEGLCNVTFALAVYVFTTKASRHVKISLPPVDHLRAVIETDMYICLSACVRS